MTLAEAGEIFAYWAENPPTHLMAQIIARALGWQPAASAHETDPTDPTASPPPGIAAGAIGMPEPVLDHAALQGRNRARAASIARRNAHGPATSR